MSVLAVILLVLYTSQAIFASLPETILFSSNVELWKQWKLKHGKTYDTDIEEARRFQIWCEMLQKVKEHNIAYDLGLKTFKTAMNEFADMTGNEFAASRLRSTRLVRSQQIANHSEEPLTMGDTADAVDWRKEGYVTAVKNQGMDGNACHYSATGSLEGQHKKQSGDLVSFSEEQLNECCEECVLSGTVQKCFQWWIKNGGASSEKDYTSWNGRCDDDAPIDSTVRSFTNVEKYSESSLQSAVYNVGPISVSIDASHWSFQVYSSGIYYEPACSETVLDHSVLVVGYDSSGSLNDYWIVKNSWGSSWGQEGYIWMARNANNNCGIASDATYPVV